jgi:hypothetical protein
LLCILFKKLTMLWIFQLKIHVSWVLRNAIYIGKIDWVDNKTILSVIDYGSVW